MPEKGLMQVYTGSGKGKTTAALGLAVRAAGAGLKTVIFQFLKPASLEINERKAIEKYGLPITVKSLDVEWDMAKSFDDPKAVAEAKQKIAELCEKIAEDTCRAEYDIIILDEINFCLAKGLAEINSIKKIIAENDPSVEIILTGRGASDELMEMADLVTEMKEVKHPYEKGLAARRGIEF